MNDLISRLAAIDALGWGNEWEVMDFTVIDKDDAICQIEALPSVQPEPRWIPCSERLPEENMWTICQNNAGAMMIGKYDIEFGWIFPAYFDGIVAWKPLPEPFKEGEE